MAPKRTTTPTTTTAKFAKTGIDLHPSQVALAERAIEACKEGNNVILSGPPGYGKTRALRGMLDGMNDEAGLTIYVAKTPALARSQAVEVNALYKVPFLFSRFGSLMEAMRTPPVRITMTQTMFKKLLYENTFVSKLAAPLGTPTVHLVLDEVHGFYATANARPSNAMKALLQAYPSLRVTGLTATPQLEEHGGRATILFGNPPQVVEYTTAEEEAFEAALLAHQPPKATWKEVPLPKPSGFEKEFATLATLTVGNSKKHPGVNIDAWMARDNLLNTVLAAQLTDGDAPGGPLFKSLKASGVSMKRVQDDGSFTKIKRAEVVLLCFHKPAGNEKVLRQLEELQEAEGVRAFAVHDLRSGDLAEFQTKRDAFFRDATTSDKTVFGVVDKGQTEGSNDYAKNVSTIVAVGGWSPSEKTQLGGRLGRPCDLAPNDLVPEAHSLLHFTSDWAKSVAEIGLRRHSPRTVQVPEAVEEWIDDLEKEDRDKVYKLLDGGKHLDADLATAYKTFDLTAYEAVVGEWCCYKDE